MIFGLMYIGYLVSIMLSVMVFFASGGAIEGIKTLLLFAIIVFSILGAASVWILDILPDKLSNYLDELGKKRIIKKYESFICGILGGLTSIALIGGSYRFLTKEVLLVIFIFSPIISVGFLSILIFVKKKRIN